MREIVSLNNRWAFSKKAKEVPGKMPLLWEKVNLPHSWNAKDGMDGGADYHRGTCYYVKEIAKKDLPVAAQYYLEICGANSSADVYVNGKKVAHHDGGYSTWRVNLTEELQAKNVIVIAVDNAENEVVYPQMADFTFYGGLYRNVNLIAVADSHFDLDNFGGPGIKVTPIVDGENAKITIEAPVINPAAEQELIFVITDAEENEVVKSIGVPGEDVAVLEIPKVHLWHGRKDPYLYKATVKLVKNDLIIDEVSARFGCRTFRIDPEEGFILNGESYPLRGVSRHQDRWGYGNALLPEHHKEDMELICEMGATTIRLAHYQHDQYFYDLCDEYGQVIWAEIPYISKHMPTGRENTVSQMKELITQNYNHPSIVVWGLSNEITINGVTDDLLENHHILNNLAHEMDPTRLTTMAVVSMCDKNEPYVQIPDTVSYNHYFGWYGGDTTMNGPWFDDFHQTHPNIPIGCSEYGCEALDWHTSDPKQGDYTEEYQAYYHEELIKQLFTRKYLWATHVWNMFDFGADARNEGGENGQNHKGLMTIDRKYKKDAFYAYKAWLTDAKDDPFVHICGKRYIDRVEDVTKITVYSNLPEVELFVNGKSLGKKESAEHFFYFDVPNKGKSTLVAVAGDCQDSSSINKVDKFNEKYRLKEKGAVLNWFDVNAPEGYFSLNDKIGDILANPEGQKLFADLMKQFFGGGEGEGKKKVAGFEVSPSMMKMLGGFTVLRAMSMAGSANITVTKEQLLALNEALNKIKK
ncbi:MAG: glycoside hydrolase family 2 protein [Lachnospiraceae bacterium]|nr:glycoside hydrolase family 2 protein [Lachnospiraceae bacterium]